MPSTATMKAAQVDEFGGPEAIKVHEVPIPVPAAGQVLVRVKFASVNAMDWKMRQGLFKAMSPKLPYTPGGDLSGTVEAAGPGVDLQKGAPVFGRAAGCYAELAVGSTTDLAPKPAGVRFEDAAALPIAAGTAWQALVDRGQLKAGQRVLIHGASGGVGHFAVQIAKLKGAYVIATASAANTDFVRSLGTDEVLDYRSDFGSKVKDVDLVLDGVGAETQAKSYPTLKPGGRLISLVGPPPPAPEGIEAIATRLELTRELLLRLTDLAQKGQLKVTIGKIFPLAEAGEAQEYSHSGGRHGKVLIAP